MVACGIYVYILLKQQHYKLYDKMWYSYHLPDNFWLSTCSLYVQSAAMSEKEFALNNSACAGEENTCFPRALEVKSIHLLQKQHCNILAFPGKVYTYALK